jgi:epoxyqueuosine reductase
MIPEASLAAEIITRAESYDGIRAGIVRLGDVLKSPSYLYNPEGPAIMTQVEDGQVVDWPAKAQTVLVLGFYHPEEEPRLDWWERGNTGGNRHLREISELLKQWFQEKYHLNAYPLPYDVEKGGLFLKDAAVLAGMGIIGRSNLFLHPEKGPRIRLRSILLEEALPTTEALDGFAPCDTCDCFCQKTCPMKAFPKGKFHRPFCRIQMNTDFENKVPDGEIRENGKRNPVIKYCRACELSCPVGA